MKITEKQIIDLKPCKEGLDRYFKNPEEDLLELLINLNERRPEWSRWLFTHLMTKEQKVIIAIFSAKQVLSIFEDEYPDDKRPRTAIEMATKFMSGEATKQEVIDAANAAADAYAAAEKELQEKIIKEAVRILESV